MTAPILGVYWRLMIGVLKLGLVFLAIVIALRKNLFVGYILFAAGIATALFFGASFAAIGQGYWDVITSYNFLRILAVIILITFMGKILKEIGYLDRLVQAGQKFPGGIRSSVTLLPMLVGMMPMPGGALLSAPLINKILPPEKYPPAFATAVNYWARHLIEFWWPVYPGIILAAALTNLPIGTMALLQAPMTFVMLILGYFFFLRRVESKGTSSISLFDSIKGVLRCLWPIILAIFLYAVTPLDLVFAIFISILLLLILERPSGAVTLEGLKQAFSPRLLALVVGIMSFQEMLEISGAVNSIPEAADMLGLPAAAVIIAVSFTAGMLTGMLAALVGLSYPILAGYLYQPDINLSNIFLAFMSGYLGMMLSPTHFCLILTNEYFRSELSAVYRIMTVPYILLFLAAFLLYVMGYPWRIFI